MNSANNNYRRLILDSSYNLQNLQNLGSVDAFDIKVDSNDYIISSVTNDVIIWSSTGSLLQTIKATGSRHLSIDSSGYIYSADGTTSLSHLNKFNTSGDTIWSKSLDDYLTGVDNDSLNNVYVSKYYRFGDTIGTYSVVKYSESGTYSWSYTNGTNHAFGICTDDSRVYVGYNNEVKVISATSGLLTDTWSHNIGDIKSIDYDNYGNVYIKSHTGLLRKLDSSGIEQWTFNETGLGYLTYGSLVVDKTNGDVYASSRNNQSYNTDVNKSIYKLDTNGNLQWTIIRGNTSTDIIEYGITYKDGYVYTAGSYISSGSLYSGSVNKWGLI